MTLALECNAQTRLFARQRRRRGSRFESDAQIDSRFEIEVRPDEQFPQITLRHIADNSSKLRDKRSDVVLLRRKHLLFRNEVAAMDVEDLQSKTVKELRAELKKRSIPVSGRKAELVRAAFAMASCAPSIEQ